MKKIKLLLKQHREIGGRLKNYTTAHKNLVAQLSAIYGDGAVVVRKAQKARSAVRDLGYALDANMIDENGDTDLEELSGIYPGC